MTKSPASAARLVSEIRLDSQFVHRGNQAADVVGEDFAERFVFHRHVRLAPHRVTELRFYHAERRFDV